MFPHYSENLKTKKTVQILFYGFENVVLTLFSLLYQPPILFPTHLTLQVRLPRQRTSYPEISFPSVFFYKSDQNRTKEEAFWGKGSGCFQCLRVINSRVKRRGSTFYTSPGTVWWLLEIPHFLKAVVGGLSSSQQMQLTLEYSSRHGKANPCPGGRLQERAQVNIWASIQNTTKRYLNFIAGKCSKQDKILRMTSLRKTTEMTVTNLAYLNTETELTTAVHL